MCVCAVVGTVLGDPTLRFLFRIYTFFLLGNLNVSKMQKWMEDKEATDE